MPKKDAVKGMLGKWVKERVKKLSFKEILIRTGDEVVAKTKSKADDKVWAEIKDFINSNWK